MSLRPDLLQRIASVDAANANVFATGPCETLERMLPLYRNHRIVVVRVFVPEGEQEFRYADNGTEALRLGSIADILELNRHEGLRLLPTDVSPYLRFVFETTRTGGELVQTEADLPWNPTGRSNPQLRAKAQRWIHPIQVKRSDSDEFAVCACVLDGRDLVELDLNLSRVGDVHIIGRQPLLQELPLLDAEPTRAPPGLRLP